MNSIRQTAQSLFIIYNYLPKEVRKEFNNLIKKSLLENVVIENDTWLKLSKETLSEIWETLENEIWDEYYNKQAKIGKI